MLHTDDVDQKYGNDDKGYGRTIKLFVRKNRDGKLGDITYSYFGDYVQFIEKEWVDGIPKIVEQDDLSKPDIKITDEDLPF